MLLNHTTCINLINRTYYLFQYSTEHRILSGPQTYIHPWPAGFKYTNKFNILVLKWIKRTTWSTVVRIFIFIWRIFYELQEDQSWNCTIFCKRCQALVNWRHPVYIRNVHNKNKSVYFNLSCCLINILDVFTKSMTSYNWR